MGFMGLICSRWWGGFFFFFFCGDDGGGLWVLLAEAVVGFVCSFLLW